MSNFKNIFNNLKTELTANQAKQLELIAQAQQEKKSKSNDRSIKSFSDLSNAFKAELAANRDRQNKINQAQQSEKIISVKAEPKDSMPTPAVQFGKAQAKPTKSNKGVWVAAAVFLCFAGCVASIPREPQPTLGQILDKQMATVAARKEAESEADAIALKKESPAVQFAVTFHNKAEQASNWNSRKEALLTSQNNSDSAELFAKNSCQLKQEFNGDAQAAADDYLKVNEYLVPISATDKAEVYQMQFDALIEVALCQ